MITGEVEKNRLEALHNYKVLDTASEASFDRITRLAQKALQVPIVLVSLVDEDRQWFKSRQGLDAPETPRDISFCTHAIQKNDPYIVEDARTNKLFSNNPLVTGDPHIRSYAGFPLNTPDGYNIGTLCAIDREPRSFNDSQIETMKDLASLIIDELELRSIAMRDSLTGALTRRQFEVDILKEMARSMRRRDAMSLLALDIDHFKQVNDTYGHGGGDAVLKRFVSVCNAQIRQGDILGRMGGEEFMIALPSSGVDNAMVLAERIRRAVEAAITSCQGRDIQVTVSIGLDEIIPGDDLQAVMDRADQALYAAKGGGRNRVNVFDVNGDTLKSA